MSSQFCTLPNSLCSYIADFLSVREICDFTTLSKSLIRIFDGSFICSSVYRKFYIGNSCSSSDNESTTDSFYEVKSLHQLNWMARSGVRARKMALKRLHDKSATETSFTVAVSSTLQSVQELYLADNSLLREINNFYGICFSHLLKMRLSISENDLIPNLSSLLSKFPLLKTIVISFPIESQNPVEAFEVLACCKMLENITVSFNEVGRGRVSPYKFAQVGDDCLVFIAESWPLLKNLSIHADLAITDDGIEAFASLLPLMESLCIFYSVSLENKISSKAVNSMLQNCPNLRRLNFWHTSTLADTACKWSVDLSFCPKLEELRHWSLFSLQELILLLSVCRKLTYLELFVKSSVLDSDFTSLIPPDCKFVRRDHFNNFADGLDDDSDDDEDDYYNGGGGLLG